MSGSKVIYSQDSGKWEIYREDGFEYSAVHLTYPNRPGDSGLPWKIAVVQLNGKAGVCIERDPDDICGAGVLMRS
jgi:hypothetical protein